MTQSILVSDCFIDTGVITCVTTELCTNLYPQFDQYINTAIIIDCVIWEPAIFMTK